MGSIAVIGSGYVGTVLAACMAKVGHDVTGVEIDTAKLQRLRSGEVPFFEPGLEPILVEQLAEGRLTFTDDTSAAVAAADVVFLCVGTPTTVTGHPDMRAVDAAARAIGRALVDDRIVVTKSTVPIGSGHWLATVIADTAEEAGMPGRATLVSNPEFLREGSAVMDFLHPDRIVIGSDDPAAVEAVAELYRPLVEQSFPGGRPDADPTLFTTDLVTAETVKYAANAFLATKISFINEIARICEKVGADITQVADAIGLDHRIGRPFLNAGVGWGGSCFGKDLDALAATAREYGLEPHILEAVKQVNLEQRAWVVEKLQVHLKTLRGRRIALYGLAFKPGTDDLRDSPAIDIARKLLDLDAVVIGHDPVVRELPDLPEVRIAEDPLAAADRADAVVFVTDWPEFAAIDPAVLAKMMRGDVVIDGRNFLDPEAVRSAGLIYEGIGRGAPGYVSPVVRRPNSTA